MPIVECPYCGGGLTATCTVIVDYSIDPNGEDWDREEVYDDTSKVEYIKCDDCSREWTRKNVLLDFEGYVEQLKGNGGQPGERKEGENE